MVDNADKWYETFFNQDYFVIHDPIITPLKTEQEVTFLKNVLELRPGTKILDLACGQGRHTVLLAKEGCQVVGLDLSETLLSVARNNAEKAGVSIDWICCDMRNIPLNNKFDVVINMFTSFGYLENEHEDQKVLFEISKALKPGGKLLLDTTNHKRVWSDYSYGYQGLQEGVLVFIEGQVDGVRKRLEQSLIIIEADGTQRNYQTSIRLYTLAELTTMLAKANLMLQDCWGSVEQDPYDPDSKRLIILAVKNS